MLCHQCGSPVPSDDSSCQNCGAELERASKRLELRSDGLRRMTQQLRAIKADGRYFPSGEVISERFELGELIGKGTFGEVYRAQDSLIDAEVAVKIFDPKLIENPVHQEQFLRTARTARTMTQTNVVRVHGSGVHKDHAWVSMQALEGLSLRKVLKMRESKGERFGLEELEPIVSQITLAIQHINREFPHGNLKPENIVFLPELIKLTDHFLYAAVDHEIFAARLSDSPYIAPELHTPSQVADPRCDVYSLGVLIGEMVFGPDYTPAVERGGAQEMAAVDTLCRRATAFDPAERYPSVEALSEDFATLVDTGRLLHERSRPAAPQGLAEVSSPPPAPPGLAEPSTPPPAPGAPEADPLLEETPRDIADPLEDDIATREYDRDVAPAGPDADVELGDLLETNEVRREELPPTPEGSAVELSARAKSSAKEEPAREATATAVKPEPPGSRGKDDKGGIPPHFIVAGLLVVVGVVVAIFMAGGQPEGKHVELGDADEAVAGADDSAPEGAGERAAGDGAVGDGAKEEAESASKELSLATSQAGKTLLAARGQAVVAAEEAGAESQEEADRDEAKSEEAHSKEAPGIEAESAKKRDEASAQAGSKPATSSASASTASASGAARKPSSGRPAKPEETASKATNCKGGMVLVKSKKGNYCVDAYEYPARGSKPTTNVSWFKAKQLCESKGKRLCSLSEWRGACGTKYPYGSKWSADKCNTVDEDEFERSLAAAGEFSSCRSWTGAYDMSGNAHEWVAEQRIAGGGFDSDAQTSSCGYSSAKAAGSSAPNIGFRCCADAE